MSRFGIVGGGLLGMTLAHRLRQAGHAVTLFEAGESLGGLASAWSLGDVVWDRHYHVILRSDERLLALLDELELSSELVWSETKTGFYVDGRFHSMSSSLEFLLFPPLNPIERARLAVTILHAARIRDWKPLESELVEDWLRRWSGRGVTEKIWIPLLRAKLGEGYRRTSAAFLWATIARMYAARGSGSKREGFGHVRGGYARILSRFTEVLERDGAEILYAASARRVTRAAGSSVRVETRDGRTREFERVVLTVPPAIVAEVCPDLTPEETAGFRGIETLGIVCPSLLLKRPLTEYYITNITDSSIPFTAVIEMSALVDRATFGGRTLVYLPKYAFPEDPIFARSDEDIRAEFEPALRRMHPSLAPGDVLAFQVSRAKHVFALPTLGYSQRLPAPATSVPGLHVVNSAYIVNGTLNVNETVQLAEAALPALQAPAAAGHASLPAGRA
jgi:protoporphyrinogen oxidase